MIKKSLYITIIAFALIGYMIYDSRQKSRGSDTLERERADTLPDNLKNIYNTLSNLKYDITTNKMGDYPMISFKTNANGLNYAVIVKPKGEILIYDGVSGSPFRLFMNDNGIKNSQGILVSSGNDFANGILQAINNKDYL